MELRPHTRGSLTNNGTIELNGGGDEVCGSSSKIPIQSSVSGTQRLLVRQRYIPMVDVDVQDQAGTATITCYGLELRQQWLQLTIGSSCTGAPTAVRLISFSAADTGDGIRVEGGPAMRSAT
jgi:hypothetical protein